MWHLEAEVGDEIGLLSFLKLLEISSMFSNFNDFFFLNNISYPYLEDYLTILLECTLPPPSFVLDFREGNFVSTDLLSPKKDFISKCLKST